MTIAFRASLVMIPLMVACAMPILGRCWYFVTLGDKPWFSALSQCASDLLGTLQRGGALVIALYIAANLTTFGVLIVVCETTASFWNAKRVYCMLAFGIVGAIAAWIATSAYLVQVRTGQAPFDRPILSWYTGVFQYDLLELLGILVGALVAALPIFKPGGRYWLARGMCPKCQYDLKGRTDEGCPECGWNRPENKRRQCAGDGSGIGVGKHGDG